MTSQEIFGFILCHNKIMMYLISLSPYCSILINTSRCFDNPIPRQDVRYLSFRTLEFMTQESLF